MTGENAHSKIEINRGVRDSRSVGPRTGTRSTKETDFMKRRFLSVPSVWNLETRLV